jgi:hypothetical protein
MPGGETAIPPFFMLVTEIDIPIFLPPPHEARSEGYHVSPIIRCIASENGALAPQWVEELSLVDVRTITDEIALNRICLGLAWEDWYIPQILARYNVLNHPGEMKYEGIYLTHDGEDLSVTVTEHGYRATIRVHEVKCTYKSTRTTASLESPKNFMWLSQIKAYCIARGTRYAVLHIMHVCGNYSYPMSPLRRTYELEFTDQELESNWRMLKEYKELWLSRNPHERKWLE